MPSLSGNDSFSASIRLSLHKSSNSTWIGDDRPCITYGLRGVVHCTVEVSMLHFLNRHHHPPRYLIKVISSYPDLHSGIDGGAVAEPMTDMYGIHVNAIPAYSCCVSGSSSWGL